MTRLEQIARAIDALDWHMLDASRRQVEQPRLSPYVAKNLTRHEKKVAKSLLRAKAAAEAMREPTDAIVAKGAGAMRTDDLDPSVAEVRAGWVAMIDAILEERT